MTMPHLMNCSHSEDGWCLDCVKVLWDEKDRNETRLKLALYMLIRANNIADPVRSLAACEKAAAVAEDMIAELGPLDPMRDSLELSAECKSGDCGKCSGEYCETHNTRPCDCNCAERHMIPPDPTEQANPGFKWEGK